MGLGNGIGFALFTLGMFLSQKVHAEPPAQNHAEIIDELRLQLFQYTSDDKPTYEIHGNQTITTDNFLTRIHVYFASGRKGAWSFDPDPLRYIFTTDDANHTLLWFGRAHPLALTRGDEISPFSALGSIWAQNDLEALYPRVSGWIGAGFVQNVAEHWKIIGALSPIFLPTFGPSLGFDDGGNVNPARFTRLPPSDAVTSGVTVPIRYQIQIGQLADVILRYQAFLGANLNNEDMNLDLYTYTAPKPDVVALTNAKLDIANGAPNAQVSIKPQFPREYWSGFRLSFKQYTFQPALELAQNLLDYPTHIISLTGYFKTSARMRGEFGFLTHLQRSFSDPNVSDGLLFIRVPIAISDRITLKNMIESTIISLRQGFYWMEEIQYDFSKLFSVTANLRVIAGQDHSYFGDWRDEDSYSAGVKLTW